MRFLLPLFLCLFAISAQATIHTVSNDPNNPAQFDNLQDAHDAAAAGDTLYITPSPVGGYDEISMNRRLTLIGQGYVASTNGQFTYRTYISRIILAPTPISSLNGSKFIGLEFDQMIPPQSNFTPTTIEGIIIERCLGNLSTVGSQHPGLFLNFNIKHSFIGITGTFSGTVSNSFVFDFRNGSASNGIIFRNCIFAVNQNLTFKNTIIENSIFIETDILANNITNSTFTNNIFLTFGDSLPIGLSNNGGSGNIFNTNPLFESYDFASGSGGDGSPHNNRYKFFDTEDYHLQATSPGKFYGTDGTDIGIYGGVDPFPAGPYTGAPPIPVVTVFNLLNGIVGPNGQLQYEVEATTQN